MIETISQHLSSYFAQPVMGTAIDIIKGHHEKYNGTGYPRGLTGENIPLSGRIVAVADVFDALTSRRPYKEAFSIEKSIKRNLKSGTLQPLIDNQIIFSSLPTLINASMALSKS